MKTVIDNQLIEYQDTGSGAVILLMHGWGTGLATFDKLTADLSGKYRVIRLDFPGFGGSPNPSQPWAVDDYAKLTTGLMIKLGIDNPHAILGHSFGGRVAIKIVSQKYLSTDKLILIGAAGVKPKKDLKSSIYKYAAKGGKVVLSIPPLSKFKNKLRQKLYQSAGSSDYLNSGNLKETFLKVINEDLLRNVSQIMIPTLLIWGENDTETPVSDARKMLTALNNGKLEVIPCAGHFVYLESADQVIDKVSEFMR